MYDNSTVAVAYLKTKILTASPVERLLITHDAILAACHQQQKDRATVAITSLIDALEFHHNTELAVGLHRLYVYCIEQIAQGLFEEAACIMKELRDTWEQVCNR
jgi:flagellin-specific chaperone FliS